MRFTYKPFLDKLLSEGITVNRIDTLGIIPNYSCRKLRNDEPIDLKHIIALCDYFNVGIEDVVTLIPEPESHE